MAIAATDYAKALSQLTDTSWTAPADGVVYLLPNGGWRFISTKQSAIDRIKSQPFYAAREVK
jgi:hypothetical protein